MTILAIVTEGEVLLENRHLRLRVVKGHEEDEFRKTYLYVKREGSAIEFFHTDSMLKVFTPAGRYSLGCTEARTVPNRGDIGVVEFTGEKGPWRYTVRFRLSSDARWVDGEVEYEVNSSMVGWLAFCAATARSHQFFVYPWLSGDRPTRPGWQVQKRHPAEFLSDVQTRAGFMEIFVTNAVYGEHTLMSPKNVWANLCGVPMIIVRGGPGRQLVGGLGFPVAYAYGNSSLAWEETPEDLQLFLGWGLTEGEPQPQGYNKFVPRHVYRFLFQLFALPGSFAELAHNFAQANGWSFAPTVRRRIRDSLEMCVKCMRNFPYTEGKGYHTLAEPPGDYKRSYYSNFGRAIHLVDNPWAAFICYELFKRTRDEFWRQRAFEQLDFILQSQHPNGGVLFYYDTLREEYVSYQSHNYMLEKLALCANYMLRTWDDVKRSEGDAKDEWRRSALSLMALILAQQNEDGSFPQHVRYGTGEKSGPIAGIQILIALDTFHRLTGEEDFPKARDRLERYVVTHHLANCYWNGRNPDFPPEIQVNHTSANDFIQYCIQRFELTREEKYVEWGAFTAYWHFFAHVPKQLEGLQAPTQGAVIEQSGWLIYNIDLYDNLVISPLVKLALYTGDGFLGRFVKQRAQLQMVAQEEDPQKPSYGLLHQAIVEPLRSPGDPTGMPALVERGKQIPTGIAFFSHQVPAAIEDYWAAPVCFGNGDWAINLDAPDPELMGTANRTPHVERASSSLRQIRWDETERRLTIVAYACGRSSGDEELEIIVRCKGRLPTHLELDGEPMKPFYKAQDDVLTVRFATSEQERYLTIQFA